MGESGRKMFYGQKELAIDDKARLVLPSMYRDEFTGGLCYVTLSLDNCIKLLPQAAFDKKAMEISQLSEFIPEARELKRTFMGLTFLVNIDSHNRILIPKALADRTELGKKVTIVGVYDALELWNSDKYKEKEEVGERNYSTNASKLLNQ